ncbi:MAG: NAD-dependent epimerase/dehydratase family protein [Alphaproteobacteria bacterium]|nr:MAG: NAD-dependent epimerase/dehydratase family protein [Alphaproteobacteria bacterium]
MTGKSKLPACVVITGGTGSFGRAVLGDLLAAGVEEVRIFSRDEAKQDAMRAEIDDPRVRYRIGDVRDAEAVRDALRGADAVFHAAALKQVPACEFFPVEALRTNVLGTHNVLRAGIEAGVRSVVCLSTDKAVLPVNAMGISKALMEKTALAAARELGARAQTVISVVRYGNVMGSRGSVIPHFRRQIAEGRPLTVTNPAMTRFLMRMGEAVDLVRYAFAHAFQGDLFVRLVPAATIGDLAEAVRRVAGAPDHPVVITGWRHGEKLHETLATARELARAERLGAYLRIGAEMQGLGPLRPADPAQLAAEPVDDLSSDRAERLDVAAICRLIARADADSAPTPSAGEGATPADRGWKAA